jgi:RND family efflux transporter MFP subunit
MKRGNGAFAVFSLLLAGLSGGILGCSSDNRVASVAPETVSGVTVIVAQSTTVPDSLEAVGTVRAAQSSQLASQTMGNIVEVRAQEGDRVQSGQILAVIDDSQARAAVEQSAAAVTAAQKEISSAESELALAQSTLKRYQQLIDKKSISPQEFDEIKTRSQAAESRRDLARAGEAQANAALTQARTSLANTQIRAPFAGVVTEKKADAGTFASPGTPLFTLEDTRSYRLEAMVDESDIRLARVGASVPVLLDSVQSAEFRGKVAQIVPAADAASRSFVVKIELPADARFRSGLFGRALFPRGKRSALLIPRTTIVERGQLRGVFVIDANQIAQLRYVTLGKAFGEQVEVLSGLQQGEKLVAAPGDRDLGGKQIAPRP